MKAITITIVLSLGLGNVMFEAHGFTFTTDSSNSQIPSIRAIFEEDQTVALKAEDKLSVLGNITRTYALLCDVQETRRMLTELTKYRIAESVSSLPTDQTKRDIPKIWDLIGVGRSFYNGGCEQEARVWVERAYAQIQTSTINPNRGVSYLWDLLEFYIYLKDWEIVEQKFQEILNLKTKSNKSRPQKSYDRWDSFIVLIAYQLEAGAKIEANHTIKKLLKEITQQDPPTNPAFTFAMLSRLQILAGTTADAFQSLEKAVVWRQSSLDHVIQDGDSEDIEYYTRRNANRNAMDLAWVARRQAEIGDVRGARRMLKKAIAQVETLHTDDRSYPWFRVHQAASVLGDLELAWEALKKSVETPQEAENAIVDIGKTDPTFMMENPSDEFLAALVTAKQIDRARYLTKKNMWKTLDLARLQTEAGDVDGALQTLTSLSKHQLTHLAPVDAKRLAGKIVQEKGLAWAKKWAHQWVHVPDLYANVLLGMIEGMANPTGQGKRILR